MAPIFKLYSLLLVTTCGTSLTAALCTGEWTGTAGNDWNDSGSWSNGCVPVADGDMASFGLAGPTTTIDLNIPVTFTDLTFNNPSQNFTITPILTGAMTVMSNPTINVLGGTQTFNQPITTVFGDTLVLTVDGILNNNVSIGSNIIATADLVIDGTGTIDNGNSGNAVLFGNTLTQNGVTINNLSAVGFGSAGNFTMNGGVINNNSGGVLSVCADGVGSAVINDGVINNNGVFSNITHFTMNGGTFANNFVFFSVGPVTINGGTLINQNGDIDLFDSGAFIVNGGTVINQAGSGPMNLEGVITINGGLFQNDGLVQGIGPATVNGSGVASGIGNFAIPFTNSGNVIPGDLPGTLSFAQYTQTAAGNLRINVLDSTVFGAIASASSADLAGTLTVAPYPGFTGITPGTPLTIVTAATDVSGTFSSIVDLFGPSVRAEVTYLPTSVILELFPNLSSFISFKEATFSTINQINLLLVNHMDRMVDPCSCPEYSFQFYVDPLGSSGHVNTRQNINGYHFTTGGVLTGFDMYLSDGGIGIAFDYERIYAKGLHDFGHFASNKYHFSGYGTYLLDPCFQVDAIVGGGWETNQLTRSTGFFEDETVRGNPNGYTFDAFLGAEYFLNSSRFIAGSDVNIVPLAGLQYMYYRINRFDERGVTFFTNQYSNQHYDSLRSLLGLKLNRPFHMGCLQIVPQINAAWQYDFLDRSKTVVATNIDFVLPSTSILIPRGAQNIILAGADVAVLYDRYTLDFSYEYEGSKWYYNHFFYLELAAAF